MLLAPFLGVTLVLIVVGDVIDTQLVRYSAALAKQEALAEVDPLNVRLLEANVLHRVDCKSATITVKRHVQITKPLTIRMVRDFTTGTSGKYITLHLGSITYHNIGPLDKVLTSVVVIPNTLRNGTYEYVPVITYKVNEFKTVRKELQPEQFLLDCPVPTLG